MKKLLKFLVFSGSLLLIVACGKKAPAPAAASAAVQAFNEPRRSGRSGTSGCETGHWIDSVMSNGEIVKLEDGSLWQVDAVDTIDTALWLPISDVIVCGDKMINTDDNETVGVTRLR